MKLKYLVLITVTAALVGCSHVRVLPPIPGTPIRPVKVSAISLLGPTINQIVFLNTNTMELMSLPGNYAAGNGIAGNAVGGVANVLGMRELRHGLSDSGDRTEVNQTGGGAEATTGPIDVNADADATFIGPRHPGYGNRRKW